MKSETNDKRQLYESRVAPDEKNYFSFTIFRKCPNLNMWWIPNQQIRFNLVKRN